MNIATRLLEHARKVAAGDVCSATVYFRAPLFQGQYLGLVWSPPLKPYADAVLDAVAEALTEWVAQGWQPDQEEILKQLAPKQGEVPYFDYLDGVPVSKVEVRFTR